MSAWIKTAAAGLLLALLVVPADRANAAPQRIVSINACADQYLLTLVPRGRILALSPFSRDPATSWHAERARRIPQVSDDAESVLQLQPDLVLASRFNNALTLRLLRGQGLRVLALGHPQSFAQARRQMIRVAHALGVTAPGVAMAPRVDRALAQAKDAARGGAPFSTLYYDRGGYALGAGSLSPEMLAHIGLENAAAELELGAITPVSIETVLAAQPDLLVVPEGAREADRGAALLAHPALVRLYPPERRLAFPGTSVVCPGPSLIPGIDALVNRVTRAINSLR